MIENFKKKFDIDGYFKVENFITKEEINKIIEEINNLKDVDIYKDRNNKIRRIERIYNKDKYLNKIHDNFVGLINEVLNKKVLIFKDKFNLKPPGGEGFKSHYDGVFYFVDSKNNKKKGWYEYGNFFISVLLSLDDSNQENGTIEIAKSHENKFYELIKNTNNDGTPILLEEIEKKTKFEKIHLNSGDVVIFKNTCPHRSGKNTSQTNRRILYYTYLSEEFGDQYQNYFNDKKISKNKTSKSLIGEI